MIEKISSLMDRAFTKQSVDLRRELPDVKSFSRQTTIYAEILQNYIAKVSNLPQLGEDFRSEEIEPLFAIPWDTQDLLIKRNGN